MGDAEEESFAPDGVRAERALVEVVVAVHAALGAERFMAGKAVLAFHAAGVLVAPADAVAFDEGFDVAADFLDAY
jgi:hypothetical protein